MRRVFLKDDVVWLIGGGASLSGFDFEQLRTLHTLAINRSMLVVPDPNVVYWTDARLWLWHKEEIMNLDCYKCCGTDAARSSIKYPDGFWQFKFDGITGLSWERGVLRTGNNSGYAAINLAIQLGAQRIGLLGYDMTNSPEGKSHHHEEYPTGLTSQRTFTEKMLPFFDSLVSALQPYDIEIINCNPESRIECFIKMTFEEARDVWGT